MRLLEGLNPSARELAEAFSPHDAFPGLSRLTDNGDGYCLQRRAVSQLPPNPRGVTLLPLAAGARAFEKPLHALLARLS